MELSQLTDVQIKTYREAFTRYDTDNDGVVSTKEVAQVFRSIGYNPTEAELQDLINTVDKDGTGSIDFPEFLMMMRIKVQDQNQEEEIQRGRLLSFDNSGTVSFLDPMSSTCEL
eukprot:TRINITY_DN19243_c0_g1_i1.p1 TRINITY_DN19243_c0_g1~~TRINITY_DN19243_c0_g1_i1.p1  ORF type:complete len:114 (-),score=25.77 TRINITY_DN19243_c0_g1_i1:29-370(-)